MFFPPGVHKINQYKILGITKTGLPPNGITDFTYIECNGLKIIGYKAKIDLKGDFDRTADLTYTDSNGIDLSYSYSEVDASCPYDVSINISYCTGYPIVSFSSTEYSLSEF